MACCLPRLSDNLNFGARASPHTAQLIVSDLSLSHPSVDRRRSDSKGLCALLNGEVHEGAVVLEERRRLGSFLAGMIACMEKICCSCKGNDPLAANELVIQLARFHELIQLRGGEL